MMTSLANTDEVEEEEKEKREGIIDGRNQPKDVFHEITNRTVVCNFSYWNSFSSHLLVFLLDLKLFLQRLHSCLLRESEMFL